MPNQKNKQQRSQQRCQRDARLHRLCRPVASGYDNNNSSNNSSERRQRRRAAVNVAGIAVVVIVIVVVVVFSLNEPHSGLASTQSTKASPKPTHRQTHAAKQSSAAKRRAAELKNMFQATLTATSTARQRCWQSFEKQQGKFLLLLLLLLIL